MASSLILQLLAKLDPQGFEDLRNRLSGMVSQIKGAQTQTEKLSFSFKNFLQIAGSVAIAAGLTEFTKQAIENEKVVTRLRNQLDLLGLSGSSLVKDFEALAEKQSELTKFQSTQSLQALSQLINFTQSAARAQQLLVLAQDIAAATGRELSTVTLALARAQAGTVVLLSRITGLSSGQARELQKNGELIAELSRRFGGFAEKDGKTAAGQLAILTNRFQNVSQVLGDQTLPLVTAFLRAINSIPTPILTAAVASGSLLAGLTALGLILGPLGRGFGLLFINVRALGGTILSLIPSLSRLSISLRAATLAGGGLLVLAGAITAVSIAIEQASERSLRKIEQEVGASNRALIAKRLLAGETVAGFRESSRQLDIFAKRSEDLAKQIEEARRTPGGETRTTSLEREKVAIDKVISSLEERIRLEQKFADLSEETEKKLAKVTLDRFAAAREQQIKDTADKLAASTQDLESQRRLRTILAREAIQSVLAQNVAEQKARIDAGRSLLTVERALADEQLRSALGNAQLLNIRRSELDRARFLEELDLIRAELANQRAEILANEGLTEIERTSLRVKAESDAAIKIIELRKSINQIDLDEFTKALGKTREQRLSEERAVDRAIADLRRSGVEKFVQQNAEIVQEALTNPRFKAAFIAASEDFRNDPSLRDRGLGQFFIPRDLDKQTKEALANVRRETQLELGGVTAPEEQIIQRLQTQLENRVTVELGFSVEDLRRQVQEAVLDIQARTRAELNRERISRGRTQTPR